MSSLWTPGGEHRVPREAPSAPARAAAEEPAPAGGSWPGGTGAGGTGPGDADEAARAAAEQLAAFEAELVAVPASDVVANHCYGLFELAAVHLRQQPPHLEEAAVAIDALGAVVERLGERLGEAASSLLEGLSSIRLAYVQLAAAASPGRGAGEAAP